MNNAMNSTEFITHLIPTEYINGKNIRLKENKEKKLFR